MASVQRVYTALKDLVNKDQRGFVTPSVFNQFASVAQMNVYNRLFDDKRNALRFRRQNIDPARDFAKSKQIEEDLSLLVKKATLSLTSGLTDKPADLGRVISMSTIGKKILGVQKQALVQLVYNAAQIDRVLNSSLSVPTDDAPVALISEQIEVFPNVNTSIASVVLTYYKLPQGLNAQTGAQVASQPTFAYTTTIPGVEIYDSSNSVDFELPEIYFVELVMEIASLIGVNLRDTQVVQYSEGIKASEAAN